MLLTNIDPCHRAWVEVNPAAIEANTKIIKNLLSKNCSLMAVVKADGYGHGALTVSQAALKAGAESLGVATLLEGIDLRKSKIDCSILVLGNLINNEELAACIDWDLMPTISNEREVLLCQKLGEKRNKQVKLHLKVDTGMTRLGCEINQASILIEKIDSLPNLSLEGIYSHLALADGDLKRKSEEVTFNQKLKFEKVLSNLSHRHKPICRHLANSAGTLRDKALHYDMVRVGLALYGYSPIVQQKETFSLNPALSVKARITFIRDVPSGVGISYGHTFTTDTCSRIAVVAIGYADGVARALSGKISVLINGELFPQVGSITMDQLLIDVTTSPDIEVGSIVTLLGSDGSEKITPYQWSEAIGSIPWEILCSFKYRLPRVVI